MNKTKKKTTKMRVNPEDSKKFFWVLLVFVLIIGIWIGVQGANQGMLTLATSAQGLTNQDGAIKVRIRALDASKVNESLYTIDQTAVVKDGQLKLRWQIPGTAKKKAAYIEVCALDKRAGPSAAVKKACIEEAGDVGYNKVSCPYYVPANSTGFSGQLNGWNKLDDSQKVGCSGGRSFSKVSSIKALASAQSPGIEIDGGGVLVAKNGKIETKDVEQFVKDALSGSSDTTVQVTTNVPVPGPQGQAGANGANGADGAAGIATVSGGGLILTGTNLSLDDSCAAGELLKWDGSNWGCAVDGGGGSDSQTLSLLANVLSISGGNSVNLSGYLDNTDSQALSWVAGTRTLSLTGGGSVVISDSDTTYSAGNGLSLGGTTFSINSPTCAGTTKLTWNGTAFSCAADVDTDTDTTNFNIAANGGAGQNISSGGTVNFTNGTGTTASRSGSDISFGLSNTAVTAGTYSPSNNANGSLALPQFTVDAQGRLTAASTTNVTLTGIANSQLTNSAITVNTAGPLAGGGAVSLGGSLNLSLDLSDSGDSATATTSSGSGLEVSGSEIGLLRGCGNTQLLKWNTGSLRWECASDTDTNSGGTVTSITAGTGLSGGVITTSGTIDIANTGVTAASYGSSTSIPVITVNAQGQITAASSSAIPTATTSTTGLLTDTDWDTFNGKENVLTFTGNGLFSRTGNTVTGLACSAGEIPKWTAGTFVCGSDIDTDTTYSAGNGLSLGGTTFSINSPTCAGTTKLTWNGTAFSCAADVDTDTDTTNFNVAAQGTVGSQNIASGDTVTFNNGTGTTATRSGSTVTYGLNNTAVTAASYAPSDNANGSLALPQFTVDAQGRLTAASTTNVTLTGIANSQLTNSAITVNTSGGLSGGSSVSLGGSVNLTIDLSDAADANTATTSSGSGLEVSGGEIGLIRGCATGELLKYNATSRLWACATDADTDTGVTTVGAIDSQTKSANGAVISGNTLYLQTADGTNVGLVSTGTQTFAGDKTFSGNIIANGSITADGDVTLGNAATDALTFNGEIRGANPLAFEGATNDGVYTTFAITDPTVARTITFPDASGTVCLQASASCAFISTTLADGQILIGNGSNVATAVTPSGDVTISNTGVTTIGANSVALATDTTGNYVADVAAGTGISIGGSLGEGWTPTINLANTAVTAASYSAADNANGSIAIPQFTVDAQGRLTAASTASITPTGIANSQLANSSLTITAGAGLANGGAVSLGGSVALDIGAGNGITVNANDITIDLTAATDGLSATTSSSSGLEVLGTGLTLLQGCSDTQLLKWNETTDVWACGSDTDTGVTSIGTIDSQTKSANGAVISGTSLVLQTADATSPGLVSTGTQTFAGAKTFIDDTTISSQFDSATAFQVQNSSAGLLFGVDAATGTTTIAPGGSGSTATLQVLNGNGEQVMNVDTTNVVNNLITNPSFEVNDTGWSYSPGYVDATQAYVGKSSLRVDAANTGDGAVYDVALASNTSYTLSFYAKAGSENYEDFVSMYAGYSDGVSNIDCLTSQTVSASGWTRYSCTFTTGTTSGTPNIYVRQNDSTARAFYIDGVQLLENTLPSSIITGTNSTFESGVGSWSGYSGSGPTQSSAQAHMGTYSGRMITSGGGGENGISLSVSGLVSPSTTYTIKAYIKADASSTQSTYQLGHTLDSGQVLTSRNGCNVVTPTSSSWKVLTCTFTTASSLRGSPYITLTQTNNLSTATTTYIDSVSMYAGADVYGTDQGFTMGSISLNGAISSPALFQNTSNSTTAFQIQGANSSTSLLVADTLNNRVAIGKALASYTLDVEGVINATESVRTPLVTSSAGLTVTGGTTLTLQSTGANAVSLDSGTTGAVNIGTGSSAKTVTVGSITGASATAIRAGTGGLTLGSNGVANTIQIGNTTGAVSQTINIGNNATASSTSNVNIGSTVAGTTAIAGPTTITGRTSGSSSTLVVNNSTSTGAIFTAQDNGTAVLTIANNGGATFKTVTNTANAFKTTNSNNDVLFSVGTSHSLSDNINLINNSSFETGSAGWTGKNGGSAGTGTGGGSVTGISYLTLTMGAVGEGAYYPVTLTANTDYTFSAYAKTGWGAMNTLVMGHQDQSGTDIDDCVLTSETIDTDWHRVSCTFTTGATISSPNIYIRQSDATFRAVDFDAVQLQASSALAAYNMGEVYFNAPINHNLIITGTGYAGSNDLTFQVQDAAGALQFGVSAGGQVTVQNGLAVNGGELTSTATTFNFLQTNVTELNIGDAVGSSGINLAGGSGSTGCTINGAVGSLTCSGNITSTATSGLQGWWSRSGTTLQPANSGDNITTSGNISTTSSGSITSAGGLQVDGSTVLGDAATDTILAKGSMIANAAATGTTDTTSGTGTNTTTVTIVGTAFANGDIILINNAGQDYYTRVIGGGGTSTLTVSPAVSFDNSVTVTKYNIQNIGATDSDYTTASNRFFQGYFLGGVVTGAGSTTLSDGRLHSTVGLNFDAPSYTFTNTSDSTSAFRVNKVNGESLVKFDTATTENVLTNGNFESNTTGWAAHGSSTISQTTSQKYLGSGSMSVATTAVANDGAKYNYSLASQTNYTMTFYVKNSLLTSAVSTINIGRSEDGSTDTDCATSQSINGAGWSKITCTFTTGNVTGTDYIYIKQTDAVARTLYVDSVQLQTSTNIATNPDIEVNTTGWGTYGGPTLSQTGSQFYTGAGSLQVDTSMSASSEGPALNTFTAQPNTTYTFSAMVMLDAGTGSNKTFSVLKRLDNIDSGSGSSCTSASLVPGTWTRLTCTFTTGSIADANPFISINVTDDGVTPITFYVDNASFAAIKWNSNDIGRISLNGSIDSPLTVRGAQDSTSAFQVQQQNGTNTLTVDTLNGRVGIGTAAPTKSLEVNGKILFKATNTDTDTFQIQNTSTTNNVAFNVAASSRAVTVGASTNTANGSLSVYGTQVVKTMTSGGSASAFSVQDSVNANVLTVSTTTGNKLVYVGEGGIDAKFQIVNTSSSAVLSIDTASTGSFYAGFDDFHIQNSTGADMIFADGANNRIIFGDSDDTSSANTALLVVDSASTANLPAGVNGGIVYDTSTSKFKIYEGGAYKTLCNTTDLGCAASASIGTINSQTKSANGAVISGNSLVMQTADTSFPGLVSTTTQTFAGDKTFNGDVEIFGSSINLGNNAADLITATANLRASNSATGTTDTTSGTGTNTTTLTIVGTAFSNNDVILIDNAGQDYYTRVVSGGGTSTLTVSPAISFDNSVTVTKYNIQNIGATPTDYTTTANRFFQGYFLGGVVTGSGSTTLSDGLVSSTGGTLNLYGGGADGASAVGLIVNTPSYSTSGAKLVAFQNNGTEKFSVDKDGNVNVVSGAAYKINGSDICTSSGCAVLVTSGIQNQIGSDQTGDFRISGTGRANGSLQTPLLDTATATALDVGTTNATGINLNQNTTVAAGKNFNAYGRSIFKSSTGLDNAFQVQSSGNDVLFNIGNAGYNTSDTNLITNSNFENSGNVSWNNKNGGSVGGGGTNGAYSGSWWMSSYNTGVDDGTKYDLTLSPSTTYTFSAYVRLPSGSMSTLVLGHQDQSGTDIDCATSPSFADTDGWVRVSCIFTTGGTISNSNVYIKQSDASSRTIYIDAVMLQARGYLSAYTMGDNFFAAPLTRGLIISGANGNQKALDVQSTYGTSLFNVDSSTSVIGAGVTMNFLAPDYIFKNTSNSVYAFQVQDQSNNPVLNVNTNNNRIEFANYNTSGGLAQSSVADGASAIGFNFNTANNFTTSGAKLLSISNWGVEKFYVDKDGGLSATGGLSIEGDTTLGNAATDALTITSEIRGASPLVFEGTTNDNVYTTFAITDPTTARTITFPDATGTVILDSTLASTAFVQNGNSFSASAVIGTNDTNALIFETDSTARGRFASTGEFLINTSTNTLNSQVVINSTAGKDTGLNILGNVNSFYQLNIQNTNSGSSASSDFVATADNGTATTNYVDFGINGSTGGAAPFTGANDAYLYASDSNNLHIGALGSSGAVKFYTTGGTATPSLKLTLDSLGALTQTASSTTTTAFTLTANSLTSGNGLAIGNSGTGLTGNLFSVTSGSTGAVSNGIARFNFSGAHTGNGVQIDDVTTTGNVVQINATALTTGKAINITGPSSTPLFDVGYVAANFGGLVSSGGFFGSNSYYAQDFSADVSASSTADSATVGDDGTWYVDLSTAASTESWSQTDNIGGFVRMTTGATTARGVLLGFGAAQNNLSLGFSKANLPVAQMKVRASNTDSNHDFVWGLMDQATAVTADNGLPSNGMFFSSNNNGTSGPWVGVVRSGGSNVGTVNCTSAGNISNSQFAVGRIQVESSTSVRFLIDVDASNGVNLVDCGTVSGANPAGSLGVAAYIAQNNTTGANYDVDYSRVWQDDPVDNASADSLIGDGLEGSAEGQSNNSSTGPVEDSSNEALLERVKSLESNVADIRQYKDVLTTEAIGESSLKKAIFIADVEFRKQVEFSADALFKANVNIDGTLNANGRVVVSNNTGTITIQPGQTEIQVLFAKSLQGKPNVFLSTENPDVKVVAQTRTKDGFVIKLSEPTAEPLDVQWFAVEKE